MPPKPDTTDGRLARSVRTRKAVVEAMLDLLRDGDPQPSFKAIAARAGVSLRLVFHHFRDAATLDGALLAAQLERVFPMMQPPPTDGPFDERVTLIVARRAEVFEFVAPVRRYMLRQEPFRPQIADALAGARELERSMTKVMFLPELGALSDRDGPAIDAALSALTSFSTWDSLRRHQGLSIEQAQRALSIAIHRLLRPHSKK